jgi:hypothetical protein
VYMGGMKRTLIEKEFESILPIRGGDFHSPVSIQTVTLHSVTLKKGYQKMQMRIAKNQIDGMLSRLGQGDFDTMAEMGRTVLVEGTFDDGYTPPKLADNIGWKLQLSIAVGGKDKSHKRLILLPADNRARKVWMRGQVGLAKRAGLKDLLAKAWASSNLKRRHELLDNLAVIMKDPKAVQAYLAWNKHTPQQEWMEKYGIKDNLHPGARNSLAEQVEAMVEVERQWNDPTEKLKREQQKAARVQQNNTLAVDPELAKLLSRTNDDQQVKAPANDTLATLTSVEEERRAQMEYGRQQLDVTEVAATEVAEAAEHPEPIVDSVAVDTAVPAEGGDESAEVGTILLVDEAPSDAPAVEVPSNAGVDVTVADAYN